VIETLREHGFTTKKVPAHQMVKPLFLVLVCLREEKKAQKPKIKRQKKVY